MKILSLETSGRQASVATLFATSDKVNLANELVLSSGQRSAQTLLPSIAQLLDSSSWLAADIELITVTTGPGSFTGLRIGVTAAKTLAFAIGAKLVGVHTLSVIAARSEIRGKQLWAIMDAQRQELFAAKFEGGDFSLDPITRIVTIDDWLAALEPGDAVVGPPLTQLVQRLPPEVRPVDQQFWLPTASVVGQLGYQKFTEGYTVDPMQLVPNYYRKSAAEEKSLAKTTT